MNFNDSLWQAIFEIFQIWAKYARLEWVLPQFPYVRHLQAIAPSFETIIKLSSNDKRETFCGGLKWMCNIFEINPQQDFEKLVIFTICSLIELAQRSSYQFCLTSFSDFQILNFFPLSYNGNNLSVKLLKWLSNTFCSVNGYTVYI